MADPNLIFIAGGTLPSNSPSYIERKADRALLEALREGEFAYVLDSRQKGKSSLMIRTRERLEAEGIRTVLLDLQRFGSNLGPEQWYGSMLLAVGEELGNEQALLEAWDAQPHAGPMKRFFTAVEQAVAGLGPVVIFVDEIDFVRSLPFATDEFFAGIRESFNRRAAGSASNLTFCLLGVATPSELIRDVQITPFNVGKRIDLTDFTLEELAPYEAAFGEARDGRALVRRIHHWTGGHPYLTQKLAAAVAADASVRSAGGVDRIVEAMFFSVKARAEEPNLADVSRRVLEAPIEGVSPEEARARVLDLYRQVRDGKRVRDDETDPVAAVLKLSGLTRILEGYLVVRNRVYFRAFDRAWIEAGLPDAELVRQRRAARSAALRVGLVTGAIAIAIGGLAVFGFAKAREANARARSEAQARTAADKLVYLANMNLIQTAFEANQYARVQELLDETAKPQFAAFRGPEWGFWDYRMNTHLVTLEGHLALVADVAFSPDSKRIATASFDNTARIWEARSGKEVARLAGHQDTVWSVDYSPDGGRLATAGGDGTARVWDAYSGQEIARTEGHAERIWSAEFSPDGSRLATASDDGTARVWDARTGRQIALLHGHHGAVTKALFSKNGAAILTEGLDNTARVWDARTGAQTAKFDSSASALSPDGVRIFANSNGTNRIWNSRDGREITKFAGNTGTIASASFSPDGSRIVTRDWDRLQVWDTRSGKLVARLAGHEGQVFAASFSPDGSRIVTASDDGTARVWDTHVGREIARLAGHVASVRTASFSPNGTEVVTASDDFTARVWDIRSNRDVAMIASHRDGVLNALFSNAGNRIVTVGRDAIAKIWVAVTGKEIAERGNFEDSGWILAGSSDGARIVTTDRGNRALLRDTRTNKELAKLEGHSDQIYCAAFSPDGSRIVTGSEDDTAICWEADTGHQVAKFLGHADSVVGVEFSADGTRAITASLDGTARIWELQSGKEITRLEGHNGWVLSASLSHDESRAVTASKDLTARVWDLSTGKGTARLEGHTMTVTTASFSLDGTRIVTASADKTTRVWDAQSGRELLKIEFAAEVRSASFSPDGRFLIVATGNEAQIIPLSREAAKELTFIHEDRWVAEQLQASARAGDGFAWNWQVKHWLTPELAKTEAVRTAIREATKSPNRAIAQDAAKR